MYIYHYIVQLKSCSDLDYLSYTFFIGSFYAFIHGIYPDIFITNSSDMIRDVSIEMKKIGCRKNEN